MDDERRLIDFPWGDRSLLRQASQFYLNYLLQSGEEMIWPFCNPLQRVYLIPEDWKPWKVAFLLLGLFNQEFEFERSHYRADGARFPNGYADTHRLHSLKRTELPTGKFAEKFLAAFPNSFARRDRVRFVYAWHEKVFVFSDVILQEAFGGWLEFLDWGIITSGDFDKGDSSIVFRTPYAYYQDFVDVKIAICVHALQAFMREASRQYKKLDEQPEKQKEFDFSKVNVPADLSKWEGEYKKPDLGNSLFYNGFSQEVVSWAILQLLGDDFFTKDGVVIWPKADKEFFEALQTRFPWLAVEFDMETEEFSLAMAEKAEGEQRDV